MHPLLIYLLASDEVPVVDSGSSSRFGQRFFWIAAQTCSDKTSLSSAPRCIKTHPEHEEHCYHVEIPGVRERRVHCSSQYQKTAAI